MYVFGSVGPVVTEYIKYAEYHRLQNYLCICEYNFYDMT
jgi:hypothetical protein